MGDLHLCEKNESYTNKKSIIEKYNIMENCCMTNTEFSSRASKNIGFNNKKFENIKTVHVKRSTDSIIESLNNSSRINTTLDNNQNDISKTSYINDVKFTGIKKTNMIIDVILNTKQTDIENDIIYKLKDKTVEFIKKASVKHNNKYSYENVEYINNSTHVKINCQQHGIFSQTPQGHLRGRGCRQCAIVKRITPIDEFKQKATKIHGEKYIYDNVVYINSDTNIKIICKIHGEFEQLPRNHLSGKGCQDCGGRVGIKFPQEKFIKKCIKIHGDIYNYDYVIYVNAYSKVNIICIKHGIFEQRPHKHLQGQGCPKCKNSKGELLIFNYFTNNNITFVTQRKFPDCFDKQLLRFDAYLEEYNLCIEFDGDQHYANYERFGGEEGYKGIVKRDNIKNKYCKNKEINLLRMSNRDMELNKIESILETAIKWIKENPKYYFIRDKWAKTKKFKKQLDNMV